MSNRFQLPSAHEIATAVCREVLAAYDEIAGRREDPEKMLAAVITERLQRHGYYAMVGTKNILREFGAAIDIVAWKASFAQAIALVVAADISGDRLVELDEFRPKLLVDTHPLIKIFVDLSGARELRPPAGPGESYYYGLSSLAPSAPAIADKSEPDPF